MAQSNLSSNALTTVQRNMSQLRGGSLQTDGRRAKVRWKTVADSSISDRKVTRAVHSPHSQNNNFADDRRQLVTLIR